MRALAVAALLLAACAPPPAPPRAPVATNLRSLVGTRDKHEPVLVALAWTQQRIEADDGPSLVAWAESRGALLAPTAPVLPGDLVVFDHAVANAPADLVGLVLSQDTRGVIEFLYVGGRVVRRGFASVEHPSKRRDKSGAVLNTFLRHGKQWPPKGTHYLAGELLAHVIRVH